MHRGYKRNERHIRQYERRKPLQGIPRDEIIQRVALKEREHGADRTRDKLGEHH